ncbi:DNA polymerase III subunit delta' [Clostridium oryzae]|uniref:DNA polymerase III subunit delta' n=1 Tax=Clostridium oryzae TaxID=1450648 RepID=A0A1V4ILZ8_9CLOT|nr:DNA polymerase III subunit delta' [Clostridium oryzae]OPJ61051.1 DNA polymerase III subunit delta' [Clostridium oryzae]
MQDTDIIGHNDIREYFKKQILDGSLVHAHLIIGKDGIGKSLITKETAVKLIGKSEIKQYVDICEFKLSKNKKSIGIDQVRALIDEVNKKPYEGDKKVIIIYSADKLTVQAQNAVLKTIEEPPAGVYIFILCENVQMILDTIKSRCQIHKLNPLSREEMLKFIYRKYPELDGKQKESLLVFAEGIPGRCEYLKEDEDFRVIRDTLAKLIVDINKTKESEFINKYINFFIKYNHLYSEIFEAILSYVRDIILYKDITDDKIIINRDKIDVIKQCCDLFSYNSLQKIVSAAEEARKKIVKNVNFNLVYNVFLIDIFNV